MKDALYSQLDGVEGVTTPVARVGYLPLTGQGKRKLNRLEQRDDLRDATQTSDISCQLVGDPGIIRLLNERQGIPCTPLDWNALCRHGRRQRTHNQFISEA